MLPSCLSYAHELKLSLARTREIAHMSAYAAAPAPAPSAAAAVGPGGELFRGLNSLSSRVNSLFSDALILAFADTSLLQLTDRLKESNVGFDNILAGVKNFLPAHKHLPITRLVEAIMDPNAASSQALADTEDYLLFDPKSGRTRGTGASAPTKQAKQTYNDAIVFVVGGGSYVEYSDLLDFATRSSTVPANVNAGYATGPGKRRITYGSTEILKPVEFLRTLGSLAR